MKIHKKKRLTLQNPTESSSILNRYFATWVNSTIDVTNTTSFPYVIEIVEDALTADTIRSRSGRIFYILRTHY